MKESSTTVVVVAVLAAAGLAGWFLLGGRSNGGNSPSTLYDDGSPGVGATETPGAQRTVTLAVEGMT
ncbi:MAG: hypothetical protein HY608_07995 [Planctomycetes bacterium]|nr:hypothetical protein [Planctomycetota bacterium]